MGFILRLLGASGSHRRRFARPFSYQLGVMKTLRMHGTTFPAPVQDKALKKAAVTPCMGCTITRVELSCTEQQDLEHTLNLLDQGIQRLDVIFADAASLLVQFKDSAKLEDARQFFWLRLWSL